MPEQQKKQVVVGEDRLGKQADKFYDHLDQCKRCRDKPFDLCPQGLLIMGGFVKFV